MQRVLCPVSTEEPSKDFRHRTDMARFCFKSGLGLMFRID